MDDGSSHTASLQYRFCLKIRGMVPTILGVPWTTQTKRSATEVAVAGNPGYTLDRVAQSTKGDDSLGQSSDDNNVIVHLATSVLTVSSLDHPFQKVPIAVWSCLFWTIMHAQ